ncbi:MAG TPA: hypothetical protein VGJ06_02550 [Candidatus Acidoferrum sp.]|jgi:hypothetical protein
MIAKSGQVCRAASFDDIKLVVEHAESRHVLNIGIADITLSYLFSYL